MFLQSAQRYATNWVYNPNLEAIAIANAQRATGADL
jgi:hypothetical protein